MVKPYYGIAVAKYILANTPWERPLIIYDMGGGHGSMMVSILNFLREKHPERYETTQYYMLEISSKMAEEQRHLVYLHQHQYHCQVQIANAFMFTKIDSRPCWILAFELIVSQREFNHD